MIARFLVRRWARASLVAGLALSAPLSCRKQSAPSPPAAQEAPAPAPASLVAELSAASPAELWAGLRTLGGPLAALLPQSLPLVLSSALPLPPSAAGSIEAELPLVGVVLWREGGAPDVVVGMHVANGPELVAALTTGARPSHRVEPSAGHPKLAVLVPLASGEAPALGVSHNYFLVAGRRESLVEGGRYVAEVMPPRVVRGEPGLIVRAPRSALQQRLGPALRAAWRTQRAALLERAGAEQQARGRAPDFADPKALVGAADAVVESWLDVLSSSEELRVRVVPRPERLSVRAELVPVAGGAAALLERELVVGDLGAMSSLPASAQAALSLRGEADPASGAPPDGAALLALLGDRVKPAEAERVREAVRGLRSAQRGASVFALLAAPSPTLVYRSEVREGADFAGAAARAVELVTLAPVAAWLGGFWGTPLLQSRPAERRATLSFTGAPSPLPLPKRLSIAWSSAAGRGDLALGAAPADPLAALGAPELLGGGRWLGEAAKELGDSVATALYFDARLLDPRLPDSAPLLLAFGKQDGRVFADLSLSPPALSAAVALARAPRGQP